MNLYVPYIQVNKNYNGLFSAAKLQTIVNTVLTYVFALVHDGLLLRERVGQQERVFLETDQQGRGHPHLLLMAEILPGRHLRLVEQVAASPYHSLQQLGDAYLPLIRVLVSPDVHCHLLGHVLDDLRGDHHVAAVQAATVVRHLRELPAYAEDYITLGYTVLQGSQPDRSALAQIRGIAVPVGRVSASQASPSGQTIGASGTTLYRHVVRPGRVPRQVSRHYRGTYLSAIIVPLTVRAGFGIQRTRYCNNGYGSVSLVVLSARFG